MTTRLLLSPATSHSLGFAVTLCLFLLAYCIVCALGGSCVEFKMGMIFGMDFVYVLCCVMGYGTLDMLI